MRITPPTHEELAEIGFLVAMAGADRPTIEQARMLYLFGPVSFRIGADVIHVRTSLDAAITDTRNVVGRDANGVIVPGREDGSRAWIGAAGYLMLIDQLRTVFACGGFEGLLRSDLAGLSEADAGAIYGLRNAFVHNYGLVNDGENLKGVDRRRRRHAFNLTSVGAQLVKVGDRTDVLTKPLNALPRTIVDLRCLGDLVEHIVAETRRRHLTRGTLPWRHDDVDEFTAQFFFMHADPIERQGG